MRRPLFRLDRPGLISGTVALFAVVLLPLTSSERRVDDGDIADRKASPESAGTLTAKTLVHAKRHMVVAANPLAAAAGLEILRAGGSAIDAAIATQMVLNLVEPQSSGIGGGAFILHWNAGKASLQTYDARETAPAAAKPDRFLPKDGSQPDWYRTVHSGLSVGVPGLLRGLELAHRQHGKLPWARLFEPAIQLAENGFEVSRRLSTMLTGSGAEQFGPEARGLYFDNTGQAVAAGAVLKNPALAATLKQIASAGADAFYSGTIAEAIVAKLASAPNASGDMTLEDIAGYRAIERPPVCVLYRGYNVCGMGPPSSGGLTVGQVLKLIEPFDLGAKPLGSEALHVIAEAEKLAFADRGRYMADTDFVAMPGGLLNGQYVKQRRALIRSDAVMAKAEPGVPPQTTGLLYGADATRERSGTSHISIVDASGNAISMTTTIETAFGSRMMVNGFLLNNELTDFSWAPVDKQGRAIANRVEPGKRPRSSMSPTIIFSPNGKLWALTGSPGGSRIILFTLKTIIAMIDWKLDAQAAADLLNFGSRNGPFEAEPGASGSGVLAAMKLRGHEVAMKEMTSGVHTIMVTGDGLEGGADPRREGIPRGD